MKIRKQEYGDCNMVGRNVERLRKERGIKQKDFKEAKFTIKNIEERLENLQRENVNIEYLQYLYEGIKKKMK